MLCCMDYSGLFFRVCCFTYFVFFFKQKTAYEMRISDWSSDVCSSDLAGISFGSVIIQILLLDMVVSVDSILTAVGMTDHLPVMVIAVVVAVGVMLLAADPLARFIDRNPTVVMLALGFLLMIGAILIADGFGVHVPKGYIYAAMAFSARSEEHTSELQSLMRISY